MIGSLTLDQLRVLVAVSDCGSFSAAGRSLRRVQSAISQSVQALETTQGVTLFDRTTKTPTLTDAGRVLVAQARLVLRQADAFTHLASAIGEGLEPELNLSIDSFFPTKPIVDALRALRQRFPDLPVTLYTEGVGAAEQRLANRQVELAIFPLMPAAHPTFKTYPLMSIQLTPVVSSDHPLAATRVRVSREMLQEHVQLVLTNPYDASGRTFSIVSPRIWRFVELSRRLDFLLAGFGWANMPSHMIEQHLAEGSLVELDIDDPSVRVDHVPLFAVHDRDRPPGKAGRWLLEDLQRRLTNHGGGHE